MAKFMIFSDSSCDLPAQIAQKYDIHIIPLKVSFDRVHKLAEGIDISIDEFYKNMASSKSVPKTYFTTVREYVSYFKKALEVGQDVLCMCLSSKLSKGYECACNAKEILSHAYKSNKIIIMDTLLATCSQGVLALNAAKLRDLDTSLEDTNKKLTELRDTSVTIFTVSSLEQLARGGRMSRATATIGTLLHINPILYIENGGLVSREKAIGRHKAVLRVQQLAIESIKQRVDDYDFTVYHSRCRDEAIKLQAAFRSTYSVKSFNPIFEIGMSIGAHTGPSVVAVNCMKKV